MLKRITIIIIALLISISMCINVVYADNFDVTAFEGKASTGLTNVKGFVNNTAATIITSLRIVCVSIAIVILLVIAMKYMTSAPGDRADIKKHAVHYIISAAILFGVTGILTIISNIAGVIGSGSGE